jgi:hypothetical protein
MSKYEQMLKKSGPEDFERIFNRYGFSEKEWADLSTEQREVHYARQNVCDHSYEYEGIWVDKETVIKTDERLRPQYSMDPYFHTGHMFPCRLKTEPECDCQMCVQKIGIARDGRFEVGN